MAIEDAIAALSQHWADVAGYLSPEQLREMKALFGGPGESMREEAKDRIADLLEEALPAEHPVIQALYAGDLFGPSTLDWPEVTEELRRAVEDALAAAPASASEPRPGEAILRHVADRVLQASALTADQVRDRGGDPDDPGLIRLEQPDGRPQWPAFQFDTDGGPRPVIQAVNDLLDASADPIAAADWWLSRNSWLGDRPSDLIGRVPDDHLVRAARAVGSED
jgi:hypothetical protein